ncbi:hypothetical protein BH10BDE1_BH10BDE1_24650 [soil metagenome]
MTFLILNVAARSDAAAAGVSATGSKTATKPVSKRAAAKLAAAKKAAAKADERSATPTPTPSAQDVLVDRERRRLEELFIWKISEELKLPVEMETSFAEAIRSLNREKSRANADVAKALEMLNQAQNANQSKARGESERAVRRYEQAWKVYGALPLREVSRMRAILGSERLGRYLVAKAQMAEKLKALSAREASESERPAAAGPATGDAADSTKTGL